MCPLLTVLITCNNAVIWCNILRLFLQISDKMSGHMASEGDINAMVKEVSIT